MKTISLACQWQNENGFFIGFHYHIHCLPSASHLFSYSLFALCFFIGFHYCIHCFPFIFITIFIACPLIFIIFIFIVCPVPFHWFSLCLPSDFHYIHCLPFNFHYCILTVSHSVLKISHFG